VDTSAPLSVFEIEDQTGRMLVWTWEAKVILAAQTWEGEAAATLVRQPTLVLPRGALQNALAHTSGELRLTEERLEVGTPVYVMGTLSERRQIVLQERLWERVKEAFVWHTQINTQHAASSALAVLPMFCATVLMTWRIITGTFQVEKPVVTTADTRHARLQHLASFAPLHNATPPVVTSADTLPALAPHQVLIWRGPWYRPFIIAGQPESLVVRLLTWRAELGLVGGAGLMILSFIWLLEGH
jgi:hypothetical protein